MRWSEKHTSKMYSLPNWLHKFLKVEGEGNRSAAALRRIVKTIPKEQRG